MDTHTSKEVCLICNGVSHTCYVYIFDLNSQGNNGDDDEFIPRAPTLLLQGFDVFNSAFCVVNSTLYIFEGIDDRRRSDDDDNIDRKSVFTVDLSPEMSANFNLKLDKSMLGKAPDMIAGKSHPTAVPTPDRCKILVFSGNFSNRKDLDIDLELYDTQTKSWRQLPKLRNSRCIDAYSFVSNDVFLVHTEGGMFSLDLESSSSRQQQQRWKKRLFNTFAGVGSGEFLVVDDGICLTTFGGYDEGRLENDKWLPFDLPWMNSASFLEQPHSEAITLLHNDEDGRRCTSFCYVLANGNRNTGHLHLIIEECVAEIGKYREDKRRMGQSARLITKKAKTFRFLLNTLSCGNFFTISGFQTITRAGD